jgi:hypothetical protein
MKFAFYGQAITTDWRTARPIHAQQLADATGRIARRGGQIVADYFDVYPDGRRPWRHRRQAHQLLHAIEDPQRGFDAIVIGDTGSALTPAEYDDLLALCGEYGVQLWLPEVDEPVDPDNEEHQEIIMETLWDVPPRLGDTITQMSAEDTARPSTDPDHRLATTHPAPIPTQRMPPASDVLHPRPDASAATIEDLP